MTLAYGLLFFGLFELGASFSRAYEASLWYPAAGLRWALLLVFGWRFLPGIAVAEVLAIALFGLLHPATHYYDSWWVLLVAPTPVLYGLATAGFVRLVSLDAGFRRIRDVAWLSAGALLVPLAVAVAGRLLFFALGRTSKEDLLPTAVAFWTGDTIGILMITPLLLLAIRHLRTSRGKPIGGVVASLPWRRATIDTLTVWASMLFLRHLSGWFAPVADHLYWYLLFPPLIWISFRRGLGGSAVAAFAVSSGAAWLIPPAESSFELIDLQVLVIFLSLTSLLTGASVSSQRAAQRDLEQHNRELRWVRAQLETRNRELESRRKELSAFLRAISHDLKNPLVTIGGFVGRLDKDLAGVAAPNVRSTLEVLRSATRTLDRQLDGFAEYARATQTLERKPGLDLARIARRVQQSLSSDLTASGVRVEIAADFPAADGDPDLVFQVLLELLENAVAFLGEQPDPRVEIGWKRESDEAVFFVRDNGRGIEPRYHDKVFELFDKLDRDSGGTGMGLTLAKRIVEEHGGRIWVESAGLGSGTAICFTLA